MVNNLLEASGVNPDEFISGYMQKWAQRYSTPGTFYVTSSMGEIVADQDGNVVSCKLNDADTEYLANIKKFDVDEWRRYWHEDPVKTGSIDILDLGYWDKSGAHYDPDLEWRQEFAANLRTFQQ